MGNRADADLPSWLAAMETLRRLPATHVVPGHGERFDRGLLEHTETLLRAARAEQP